MSDASTTPQNRRTVLLLAVAVLIGALILLIAVEWGSIAGSHPAPSSEPPKSGAMGAPAGTAAIAPTPGPSPARAFSRPKEDPADPAPDERSIAADLLNDPAHDVRHDLGVVAELLAHFRGELHELPVGNNAEITAALAGDNSRAYAVLPPDHGAINANGELIDRWGTPFFFHQLTGDRMEIRSSGPDRRRYTKDDALWPAASATVADESPTVADAGL